MLPLCKAFTGNNFIISIAKDVLVRILILFNAGIKHNYNKVYFEFLPTIQELSIKGNNLRNSLQSHISPSLATTKADTVMYSVRRHATFTSSNRNT